MLWNAFTGLAGAPARSSELHLGAFVLHPRLLHVCREAPFLSRCAAVQAADRSSVRAFSLTRQHRRHKTMLHLGSLAPWAMIRGQRMLSMWYRGEILRLNSSSSKASPIRRSSIFFIGTLRSDIDQFRCGRGAHCSRSLISHGPAEKSSSFGLDVMASYHGCRLPPRALNGMLQPEADCTLGQHGCSSSLHAAQAYNVSRYGS